MSKFQSGDLALIIKSKLPENIGCVVELLQFVRAGDCYVSPDGVERYSESDGWLVAGRIRGISRRPDGLIYYTHGHALAAEERLMPLRGDFAPERQKSSEVPA